MIEPDWLYKRFIIPSESIPAHVLPVAVLDGVVKLEECVYCRVWGEDAVLEVYELEIQGDVLDGLRFFVSKTWFAQYMET